MRRRGNVNVEILWAVVGVVAVCRHWGSVFQTSPSYVLVLACNLPSGKLGEHLTLRKRGQKQMEGAGYLLPPDHFL